MAAHARRGRTASKCDPLARPFRTLTLSHRSEAVLSSLSRTTGLARGRIVDLALTSIDVCEECRGTGLVPGPLGPLTCECGTCRGSRLVPTS